MKSTGGRRSVSAQIGGAGKTIITAAWSVYINPADAKHFPMLHGCFSIIVRETAEAIFLWVTFIADPHISWI